MKVLIDERAPKALKQSLTAHDQEAITVQERGWAGKQNGELLSLVETKFDSMITVDTNLRYQQNLRGRRIAIVVMQSRSNLSRTSEPTFPLAARRW
jgi:predicted nuclease of predicted toxin-antitoxin system